MHEAVLESDGPWDLDLLFERIRDTLGKDLSPGRDLRHPLGRFDDKQPSSTPSAPPGSV